MIQEVRQSYILEKIKENKIVYISDLIEDLDVSESTIRRDLKKLESKKLVMILNGGAAKQIEDDIEESYTQKSIINHENKDKIARKAAKLINNGDTIYIDSGTTALQVINYIEAEDVTVVTSNAKIFDYLPKKNVRCILVGGLINEKLSSIVGSYADDMLKNMFFNKSFIGANGYFVNGYIYTYDEREANKKKIVISNSERSYVLADTTKKNQIAFVKFADYKDVYLITEKD